MKIEAGGKGDVCAAMQHVAPSHVTLPTTYLAVVPHDCERVELDVALVAEDRDGPARRKHVHEAVGAESIFVEVGEVRLGVALAWGNMERISKLVDWWRGRAE